MEWFIRILYEVMIRKNDSNNTEPIRLTVHKSSKII